MPLNNKPLSQLVEADLLALRDNGIAEGRTIDYKRDAVGTSDGARKEFLADVSSFANASGGHIILGIDEANGLPTDIIGLPGINPDQEISRLEELARDGIRPPITGIQTRAIPLSNGHHALVIRIPKSWNPPHQVVFQKTHRFYGRGSNGKYLLEVEELRSIFSLSESIAERIRQFRIDRISQVIAGETPAQLENGARAMLHIAPLSGFSAPGAINLSPLKTNPAPLLAVIGGGSSRFNIDGMLAASDIARPSHEYVQVFRNGCLEIVKVFPPWTVNGATYLPSSDFETEFMELFSRGMQLLLNLGVQLPVVAMLTLIGVKGWRFSVNRFSSTVRDRAFDRNPLLIPDIMLDTFTNDFATAARPILDAVWNAAGWSGSPNYDSQGHWAIRS